MSELSKFLKKNKIRRENIFYPATKTLRDDNGEPLMWEIRALSSTEVEKIRESCTKEVPVNHAKGVYRQIVDSSFGARLCAAAVVFPDLYDAELQDSYGVSTPHALLMEMIDRAGEFNAFVNAVSEHSGLTADFEEEAQQAKN